MVSVGNHKRTILVLLLIVSGVVIVTAGRTAILEDDSGRDLQLIAAAGRGGLPEVEKLLREGADVQAKDGSGKTASTALPMAIMSKYFADCLTRVRMSTSAITCRVRR
jgi:hypothetical protein